MLFSLIPIQLIQLMLFISVKTKKGARIFAFLVGQELLLLIF